MQEYERYERKEERGGKIKGYICVIAAVAVIIFIITAVILGYIVSFKGGDGEMRDGFGRMLDEIPVAFSWILPQWAGHVWLIIDCMILLGLIILVDRLFVKSKIYFKGIKNVDF